jgi:hypothetical protein
MKQSKLTLVIYGSASFVEKSARSGITIAPMPTAIVMIYTRDGFVVASDGKGSGGRGISDGEQKIFEASGPDWCLACGVSGAASAIDAAGQDVFKDEYAHIIDQLKLLNPQNLIDYADNFISKVGAFWYPEVSTQPNLPRTSMKVQLAGYFKGQPGIVERNIFFDRDGFPPAKTLNICYPRPGQESCVGSPPIKRLILAGNDDFQKFKTVGLTKMEAKDPSISLQEAMEAATQYIEACKSPKAREIDPYCETIDGLICTAVLTPTKGFEWVQKPTNLVL